jgi:hypothetical protein
VENQLAFFPGELVQAIAQSAIQRDGLFKIRIILGGQQVDQVGIEHMLVAGGIPSRGFHLKPRDPAGPRHERLRLVIFGRLAPEHQVGFLEHIIRQGRVGQKAEHVGMKRRLMTGDQRDKVFLRVSGLARHGFLKLTKNLNYLMRNIQVFSVREPNRFHPTFRNGDRRFRQGMFQTGNLATA